jgi:hypothetical protein
MSKSLQKPWILKYIKDVAESPHCSNLSGYPCPRKQRVQIVKVSYICVDAMLNTLNFLSL